MFQRTFELTREFGKYYKVKIITTEENIKNNF